MILYLITNRINGKRYVGQTVQSMNRRWIHHKSHSNKTAISRAINKYHSENFDVKILSRCYTFDEMNHRERYYIKIFNTLAPNGYNLRDGGNNGAMHAESKNKISLALKGRQGKPHTKETRLKISNLNKGKKHSENTKRKMSNSRKGTNNPNYGKKFSLQYREKLSQSHIGQTSEKRKPVLCMTNGAKYASVSEASKQLNINIASISRVCLLQRKQTHGLIFRYV